MLIVSRFVGEKIQIGDSITVVLVRVDRNRVRIGVEAPRDVPVFRTEILERRQQEQEARRANL